MSRRPRKQSNAVKERKRNKRLRSDEPGESTIPQTSYYNNNIISQYSINAASGVATGGVDNLPTKVEYNAEQATRRKKPINQGTDAYQGGGADNGTNL